MELKDSEKSVVPFIVGATASGKTAVSILVAERFGAQIISADSRQIYMGMAIGTAQPEPDELKRVPHHFVAYLNPHVTFSAGEFGRQARVKIEELLNQQITPLVVGGSGLYVSALADDFFAGPSASTEIRDRLKAVADKDGTAPLYQKLREVDPVGAAKITPSDYRRIERALEIYFLTGMPISEVRRKKANPPPYRPLLIGLRWSRDQLYERINKRCLRMLDHGLINEVRGLILGKNVEQSDLLTEFNALNSVGYAEVIGYLRGDYDYDEMVRLFQRNTRRFAKRQISWFGRDERITWIEMDRETRTHDAANRIIEALYAYGIKKE